MAYMIRYNRSSQHISGITEATKSNGGLRYAVSACPALSRSEFKMAKGASFGDLAEALKAARSGARVTGRKMCTRCEQAAERVLGN